LRSVRSHGGIQSASREKVSEPSTRNFRIRTTKTSETSLTIRFSFWFLFPVANYATLPLEIASDPSHELAPTCFGCDRDFPDVRVPPASPPFELARLALGLSPAGLESLSG
jgi:hypothetical protein